jgi:hypothetical protein
VDLGELPGIGDGSENERQVIRRSARVHGGRLEGARRGVLKAERLKNRYDVVP